MTCMGPENWLLGLVIFILAEKEQANSCVTSDKVTLQRRES